jgi:uncharacterized lipoprotein YajG|tara:strand:- start:5171 stop:5470 length:300 start_codon:yes stop_codon:yes gene_type:complete
LIKKILLTFLALVFLAGCAESTTLLGSSYTLLKTGSMQRVAVSQGASQIIKKKGKSINKKMALSKNSEKKNCEKIVNNPLMLVFFEFPEQISCISQKVN